MLVALDTGDQRLDADQETLFAVHFAQVAPRYSEWGSRTPYTLKTARTGEVGARPRVFTGPQHHKLIDMGEGVFWKSTPRGER